MTVLRTSNNTWTYDFTHLGTKYRKRFKSRNDALKAEAHRRLEINCGSNHDERITFSSAAQLFLDNHSKPCKVVWKEDARKIVFLNSLFGDKKLTELTSFDIQHMRNALQQKGLCSGTIDKYHALIKTIFNKMIQWQKFTRSNPAWLVKLKRAPNAHTRYLTHDELSLIEKRLEHENIFPYYLTALHTGMRRGEICAMKWEDINLSAKDIFVPISKSGKSRHIPMNDIMYGLFVKLYGEGKNPKKRVLYPLSGDYISRRFVQVCHKLGIWHCRFHSLRHTFASHLVMGGVNIHAVSRWLGHASITMTEKHYAYLAPDFQKKEIHQLNRLSIHSEPQSGQTLDKLLILEPKLQVI
ncbi:MAG: site-specific integrase [Endomicrobiales bacterium]|jgi:integrase